MSDFAIRGSVAGVYFQIFRQMRKQLAQLDAWFDAAVAAAKTRSFNPDAFLECRLAPDQFTLVRQVQIVCDTARLAASRLSGKDAFAQPDTEKTIEELRARVHAVIAYLDGFAANDFADAADRSVTQPRWEGKTMSGADYFVEHAVPNFYFHLAHTYAILRNGGVGLGKRDYLGALSLRAP